MRVRRPSPALVVALVALFFALVGTGLAATHYVITRVSQIKPSVRAELRGAKGPRGERGPRGVAGSDDSSVIIGPVREIRGGETKAIEEKIWCPSGEFALSGGLQAIGLKDTEPQTQDLGFGLGEAEYLFARTLLRGAETEDPADAYNGSDPTDLGYPAGWKVKTTVEAAATPAHRWELYVVCAATAPSPYLNIEEEEP
ncbi:MAG TPA: hypothetical protein VMA83_00470 [Solirubrobacteraceae bacterium]|nr:hypothetical protein [Solirubrobacteraceae bacterium]